MAEVLEFQKKANNNAFLTRERAASEEARLEKKQQTLKEEAMRMEEELNQEQIKLNQQMSDTVVNILKEFNRVKKYQIIFANFGKDNILYSEEAYNITSEILEYLNQRYTTTEK
jgi:outer membrane protein